jgi:hypothetical protein
MDDFWSMFLTLQVIVYLPSLYDLDMPQNAQIFYTQLKSLIEFRLLTPDGLMQLFIKDFSLMVLFTGKYQKYGEETVLDSAALYISAIVLFLGTSIVLTVLIKF